MQNDFIVMWITNENLSNRNIYICYFVIDKIKKRILLTKYTIYLDISIT